MWAKTGNGITPRWWLCLGLVAVLCFGMVGNAAAQRADIQIDVSLDRDTIGMDEQATLQVTVSGSVQSLPDPRMPTLPMFEVYSQGRSSNLSITNGVISSSVTYRYLIIPQKPGTFPIDNIYIIYKNHRYKGNRVELTVIKSGTATPKNLEEKARSANGKTRDYFMEAVVDKTNPYVNEQVTFTLKFYTAVRYFSSPELSEPSFTGFWTEVLGNKAPYNQRINNRTYRVIERKYAVFPTQTGKLTIGRATIRATVATRGGMSRDPFDALFGNVIGRGQEIAVHSQPVTVNVRPLPEAGKPKHFTGTIGRYSISAVANKRTVDVNQPVSVSIKITGVGNIKSVAEPLIPDLDDFRVYRESSDEKMSKVNDKLGGTKTFEEVFIPKRPGKLTIPALEFNYFDPSTGKYRVLHTRPITLKVTKPEGYAASPDVPYARPELSVSPNTQELRYIKTKLDDLHPVGALLIASPTYIIINALPVLMLAGMIAVRVRRERLAGDVAYARSRQASRLARKRLSKARSLAKTETAEQFFAEISLALTAFVADKLNMSPYGLTSDRLQELLRERGADEALVADLKTLLQQADFARFAPATVTEQTIETALHDAEQLMVRMEGLRFA